MILSIPRVDLCTSNYSGQCLNLVAPQVKDDHYSVKPLKEDSINPDFARVKSVNSHLFLIFHCQVGILNIADNIALTYAFFVCYGLDICKSK